MLRKPRNLLDRQREWDALCNLWDSERFELGIVLGRRRIGKSFALAPFSRAVDGVYYQATRRSEAEQLASLTDLLGERFDDPALRHGRPFARWEPLLRYLVDKAAGAFLVCLRAA